MKLHAIKLKPLVGRDGKPLVNPAVIEHESERRQRVENRIADHITSFSGSMRFVTAPTRSARCSRTSSGAPSRKRIRRTSSRSGSPTRSSR